MPKYIPTRHVKRMFPYEFFDELSEKLTTFTPENPVFLLRGTPHEAKLNTDLKAQFDEIRQLFLKNKKLEENNLYKLDQGEFLILETYVKQGDQAKLLAKEHVAKYVLLAQLYDSEGLPIFATDVRMETIRKIPEILHDDPNLALALLNLVPEKPDDPDKSSELAIIKGPNAFIEAFIEPIEKDTSRETGSLNG